MSVPMAVGVGVIAGIVLFFVLQRLGVVDAVFSRLEMLGSGRDPS